MRKGYFARKERERKKRKRDENAFMSKAGNLILSWFRGRALKAGPVAGGDPRSFHKYRLAQKKGNRHRG